mgnify:CR=1 FL=1
MAERNASGGYIAIGVETTKGTAVTPDLWTPYYSQNIVTDMNIMADEPVYGNKYKTYQNLPGTRSHTGTIQVMAEPNTAASWFDMLMTRGSPTGSDPYTHPFTASSTTDPKAHTMDVSFVSHVVRFMGVEASSVGINWNDDKMVFDIDVSGLKSFYGRKISSISGSGPYTITLKSDGQYDSPTDGLVVGDLIQVYDVSADSNISCEVDSLTSTTVVVSEDVSAGAADDILTLRPQTTSLSLLTPFLHSKTHYFFDTSASAAFTASGTTSNQTRLDPGTEMTIMHNFDDNAGTKRSGSFDPASLPRLQYEVTFGLKIFLDDPDRFADWNELTKEALVMRSYSGSSNEYELRVTLNDMKAITDETATDAASVIMHEVQYRPEYSTADGQAFDVKVLNSRSALG